MIGVEMFSSRRFEYTTARAYELHSREPLDTKFLVEPFQAGGLLTQECLIIYPVELLLRYSPETCASNFQRGEFGMAPVHSVCLS